MKKIFLFLSAWVCLSATSYERCIVVTTINYPTESLKRLASIPGWRLIVVADQKTPADWSLDFCDFLSVEEQYKLPYRIIRYLPWNHYCRKNIGYLYAIERGAKIIYDTDDDNFPSSKEITYLPEMSQITGISTDQEAFNVYEYFGQPDIWPRGFPLREIARRSQYQLTSETVHIPIQQGLVDNDPDVDAIFRLTRKDYPIVFDALQGPIALLQKTLCPFNSQNTIFHYSGFWGLVLPISTSFRVCDIWRGYWVQRVLWEMGASLCFLPPSAIQYRNPHDLLKDFSSEVDLYLRTSSLLSLLGSWTPTAASLEERIQDLFHLLVQERFFRLEELDFLQAWQEDLHALGYRISLENTLMRSGHGR